MKKLVYRFSSFFAFLVAGMPAFAAGDGGSMSKDEKWFYIFVGFTILQLVAFIVVNNALRSASEMEDKISRNPAEDASPEEPESGKTQAALNAIALLIGLTLVGPLLAQDAETTMTAGFQITAGMVWTLAVVNVLVFVMNLQQARLLTRVLGTKWSNPKILNPKVEVFDEDAPDVFAVLKDKLTGYVPVEEEETILMDHEYDGIRELDNNLPPWWIYSFYLSIVVAFLYFLNFQVFGFGESQAEEYLSDVARVEAMMAANKGDLNEDNVIALHEKADLQKGQLVYLKNCAKCHGPEGQGLTGPNFTDEYWIHGNKIGNLFATVKYGVKGKTMQKWEGKLTPKQMQQVSSYILTLKGTNPPNAKEPEGKFYGAGGEEENSTEEKTTAEAETPDTDAPDMEEEASSETPDGAIQVD